MPENILKKYRTVEVTVMKIYSYGSLWYKKSHRKKSLKEVHIYEK